MWARRNTSEMSCYAFELTGTAELNVFTQCAFDFDLQTGIVSSFTAYYYHTETGKHSCIL